MTTTVMRISDAQRSRIKDQEGLRLDSYLCTADRWTVGWGHAETNSRLVRGLRIVYEKGPTGAETQTAVLDENGKVRREYYEGKPKRGVSITLDEARRLFEADVDEVERQVSALVTQELAQHQFDPLVDFVYQFGIGNLDGSTLINKINFNPNNLGEEGSPGILDEFPRWNRENGHRVEHVWSRSCRRACIYANAPIPQPLWRKNGFPFAVNDDDQVDYSITPTIHRIIAHGKKVAEKPTFDPTKPLPDIILEPLKPEDIFLEKLPLPPPVEEEASAPPMVAIEPDPPSAGGKPEPTETEAPLPSEVPASTASASVNTPAASIEVEAKSSGSATVKVDTPEAKNPVNSWSIWGGMVLYFLPDLGPFAEKLLTVEVAGPIGHVLRGAALAVLIFGRIAASMPISIKAKAKLPTLRKTQ